MSKENIPVRGGGFQAVYTHYTDVEKEGMGPLDNVTFANVQKVVDGMRRELRKKPEKKSWEKHLLTLAGGRSGEMGPPADSSVMELVAKKHEDLAFLVSLEYIGRVVRKAGLGLDEDKPLPEQLAELSKKKEFQELAREHVMDPLFRKGIHAAMKAYELSPVTEPLAKVDSELNREIMRRTMDPPSAAQLQSLKNEMERQGKGEQVFDAVRKNQEQQRVMAKMLFMAHLAGAKLHSKNAEKPEDRERDYDGNMCDLLTRGGRVTLTLPAGSRQQEQFDAIVGPGVGDGAGVTGRVFATHGVTNATLNSDGSVKKATKEYKPGGVFRTDLHKNYGMDMAVGGLGAKGIRDLTVLPDGMNGHAYMKLMPGGGNTCGAMLFGVEPSAPGKASLLGQAHDTKAIKSKQSPFLSHKQADGDPYGGRTIDFSQMEGESFINIMDRFDAYYRDLQNDPKRLDELKQLNDSLIGRQLQRENLKEMLTDKLGLEAEQSKAVVEQLRKPHVPRQERVRVAPAKKPPERPGFFKRLFASANETWRKQNEAYENYVKERQAERIRQKNALAEAVEQIPDSWNDGAKEELSEVFGKYSKVAQSSMTEYDRNVAVATVLHGLRCAMRENPDVTPEKLGEQTISTQALDPKKITAMAANDPLFRYVMRDNGEHMKTLLTSKDPIASTTKALVAAGRKFAPSPEEARTKQNSMRTLFDRLNVPGLEQRSREYQEMVAAVGRMADKQSPAAADSLRVFNAVQAYAEAQGMPRSKEGREALSLAFEAMNTALPEKSRAELTRDLQPRMKALDKALGRTAPEPERKTAQPQPQQLAAQ